MGNRDIEEWFHAYHEDIYHYLQYYTASFSSDIEDLVQEVFIKAMKGYTNFNAHSSPKTWLFSIARHTAIDYLRKKRIRSWLQLQEHEMSTLPVDNHILIQEDVKELLNSMKRLKPIYREVILLRVMKDYTVSETATILNCTESKVAVTLHRALKKLREVHNPKGGEDVHGEGTQSLNQ